LARHLHAALEIVGPPRWSEADLAFMRALATAFRPDGEFFLDRAVGYYGEGLEPYGQDDGEASWRIPLGRVNWAYPRQIPLHSGALTALAGHAAGEAGPLMASEALAIAIIGLLEKPGLVEAAQAELRSRTEGVSLGEPEIGALRTMRSDPAS